MKTYYFLGIGGIGMSAIARYFNGMGCKVCGYDLTKTELTLQLENEGIEISYMDDISYLPKDIDLVVFTPAIPKDSVLLNYFIDNNFPMKKRSQVLGELTMGKKCIAIAGTHGKTTVTTMVAHLLHNSSIGCSAFLGGVSKDFGSNFVINKDSEFVVVEADEFDRSFLQLSPYYAAITSVDADHLDIYGSHEEMKNTFVEFANKIPIKTNDSKEKLFLKKGLDIEVNEGIETLIYTISGYEAEYYAWNIRNYKGAYYFDFHTPEKVIYDICLNYPGLHNIENSVLAMAIAWNCGVNEDELRTAISSFSGVKRRFDYRIKRDDFVYIDDYAHHPQELRSCIESVRDLYPNKKITGVFQPHLFSRTKDFADDFARALELLDEVVLIDIYPAREKPLPGVSSKMLLHKIDKMDKYYSTEDTLLDLLEALYPEVLLTLGAGDIDKLVKPIEERFSK
ncbi:MAG: UDP-N-acetylmuramate--L-alanine ligase [Bacteroidetes bacterium]|nr:UDP-N-acetylmuramate--L-alanine ligase [Bacteroidota bacterium]